MDTDIIHDNPIPSIELTNCKPINNSIINSDINNCCTATNKNGKKCKNKKCKNHSYCKRHLSLFKFDKPDECIICTSSMENENQPLSCGHWVHRKCIVQWKDECPICRTKIKVTKKEYQMIEKNNIKNKDSNSNEYINLDLQLILSLLSQDINRNDNSVDITIVIDNMDNNIEDDENIQNSEIRYMSALILNDALERIRLNNHE